MWDQDVQDRKELRLILQVPRLSIRLDFIGKKYAASLPPVVYSG